MKKEIVKQQEQVFARAQKTFEHAKKDYLQAVKEFNVFTSTDLLKSASFIMRAAYSDRMAWVMATMANLAYIEFETSEEEYARLKINLKSGNFELIKIFSRGSTQAFLARNDFFAVLAFRGTEIKKIDDLRADINVYKQSTKEGKVHVGFRDAYDEVALEIEESLTDKNHDRWPLFITGHSLGGALATVATQSLERIIGDQISACYTYGSPRVGNNEYQKNMKAPIYRIVNSTDIVSLVPSIGYRHVGDARFLTRGGDLYRGIPFFRRGWEMLLALLMPGRWVACHSMPEYCDKLEKYAIMRNKH